MKKKSIFKITLSAIFAAIICAATMIAIPSPTSNGYLNVGDCFVILSAWVLSPAYGVLAAGIGSALSDVILGYAYYAPATLIIKMLMAFMCGIIYRKMNKHNKKTSPISMLVSGLIAEVIMVLGYFLYDSWVLGNAAAAALAGVPGNCAQGVVGVVGSIVIMLALQKTGFNKKLGA